MEEKQKNLTYEELKDVQKRKDNIRIYKIYEAIALDFLFYYATIFLFYINQKELVNYQIFLIETSYILFKLLFYIFCQMYVQKYGKRRMLILGNVFLIISLIILLGFKNIIALLIASAFCALGFDLKELCESDLLYDSIIKTDRRGDNFSKIESQANSKFYIIDTISCLLSGFLYVLNPYLPICLCIVITILCLIISTQFQDIKKDKNVKTLKTEFGELKNSLKSIGKSKRIMSLLIINGFFIGMLYVYNTLKNIVLLRVGVEEKYFGVIFAIRNIYFCNKHKVFGKNP